MSHRTGAPIPCVSPGEFSSVVVAHLASQGRLRPETLAQVSEIIEAFSTFIQVGLGLPRIDAVGPEQALAFLDSRQKRGKSATYAARRLRRTALRLAFQAGRELGLVSGDPTIDIVIGPHDHLPTRPLTDHEIETGRAYALASRRDLRRSMAWALTEATGRTSEIGEARVSDVEPERHRVWLAGTTDVDARWGRLTEWGLAQAMRRLAAARDSDDSLIVWRSKPKVMRAACSQAVTETLKAAGLQSPGVRPRSIVAWAGRKAFDEGTTIDEVARMLGMRSLDQTAAFVRYEWRDPG